ncbi:MAG: argininosuccinate lyase [Dehalococcoidia bacterium]|jgi:argininosuccinate lyase|nr:argininosuccinate lyase [Dehalococcoidia bacterium]
MLESKSRDVQDYVGSLQFDRRLYWHDIAGSIAHARMLARQGVLTDDESALLVSGLEQVLDEFARGAFAFDPADEDIHMAIEARLFKVVGEVAGKLHTARSRNDQVALDVRMYLRDELDGLRSDLRGLRQVLVDIGERHINVVMPGYTHLQQAQPVLFAHHMLAYFEMFSRDDERLAACRTRVNVLPLGSGALAGVPYPIDRTSVARELGFETVSTNSMDAVSDRDFVAEFLFCCALIMMHVSRLSEELILWSSAEFGFITIGEGFTTGSSIMPQKRNPDLAELARGKSGRVYGDLMAMLTTLKGLPLTYNRDLQEDKVYLFDAIDTVRPTVRIYKDMLPTLQVHADRMRDAMKDYVLATDVADYLVRRGLPFRSAHGVAARLSSYASAAGKPLRSLSLDEYRKFSPLFEPDVLDVTVDSSVADRDVQGGTAPERVRAAMRDAHGRLAGEAASH